MRLLVGGAYALQFQFESFISRKGSLRTNVYIGTITVKCVVCTCIYKNRDVNLHMRQKYCAKTLLNTVCWLKHQFADLPFIN